MKKEIQQTDPNVLLKFAHLLGTEVKDGRLEIPPKYGKGYCTGYVFNEQIRILYPSLLKIINEMMTEAVNTTFKRYFIRIKTEELICRLLMELEKREEKQIYALNSHDTKSIYQIKERILHHLDTPPVIKELAISVHMSPSKLKRLFKQIFGNSIFNYYQDFRMKEAARLLKEEKLSVSEVGYQLGFTNLSHFSRIFKKHIGMNPKQYTKY